MSSDNNTTIPPHLGITFGILAASTAAIFIRIAQQDAPSLVIAAYRLGFASIILVPILFTRYREELKSISPSNLMLSLISGFLLAIHFATWITSLEFTSVASSVVLVSTAPLFVSILSPFFLNETVHVRLRFGLVLALTGTIVVAINDACMLSQGLNCPPINTFFSSGALKGDFLAILGAISGAGYVMIGRRVRAQVSLIPYITLAYSSAAIILSSVVIVLGLEPFDYPLKVYGWFLLLALLPQLIGHTTINWALRHLPAAFVSVTLLGEPVASTLWAYLLFGEQPGWLMYVGALCILLGIGIASLPKVDRASTPDESISSPLD